MGADLSFVIPGDIETLTGGYAYDRRLIGELRRLRWSVDHLALPASFPFPGEADLAVASQRLAGLADGSLVLVDGLAYGALATVAERESERLRLVALVHHPLADETGLSDAVRETLLQSERRALRAARGVIATSETTARHLVEAYDVTPPRLAVAPPGSDRADPVRLSRKGPHEGVNLISVGTLTHRKGFDLLVEALARLSALSWHCSIVGSLERAPDIAGDIRRRIARHGLQSRIGLLGEVASLAALYDAADIFVLASRHEGYGMVFAEAIQHGLPVIATTAGAIPEVVPAEAGILVPPDNVDALVSALERLIKDPAERERRAAGARAAARSFPSWKETARRVAEALRRFAELAAPARVR